MTVLDDQPAAPRPLFGFGSILLAGFIGGPPAAGVLAFTNLQTASARARQLTLGFFVAATAVWWWCLRHTPPDVISQFLAHMPVWLVLSLPTWLILRGCHRAHKAADGTFKSAWLAVGIAALVRIALGALALATSLLQ
ncbi:hypothetical protein [Mitsuaria sp. 7]|uniref:hypothetical protein n=1 Tax=Mitsuaria sp. 7 TaxID=1658665 RepID=UPI0007DD70BF|nr:hypothetical protein [Mitsuaria sp. 7]ANH67949.1 hypothetical protein ABE85_10855 [Mitsuaria sp. 7]